MANAIEWHGQNKILNSPKEADYPVLNIFNNGKVSVSCWQLTAEELAEVVQHGGKIFIAVLGGVSQYPMFVGTEESVRSVVADTGKVWKRENDIPATSLPKIIDNKCPKCKILMGECTDPRQKYCPTCDTIWNVVN